MAPSMKESGGSGRRKSMNLFTRSSLSQINTDVANDEGGKKDKKKHGKRVSMFGLGSSASSDIGHDGTMSPAGSERSNSPKLRPRTLQKSRPVSIFGSLGRRSMNNVDEGATEDLATSAPESPVDVLWEGNVLEQNVSPNNNNNNNNTVRHHGEVQTTIGLFRKKKEYLVLTDTHLIRYKSQSRAAEIFPKIPPVFGRANTTRHPSTASAGSLHEGQSGHSRTSAESENRIPLEQIVSAYRVEDGRPFFTAEVVYLDEKYAGTGSIQLMLHDPEEADLWLSSIRGAAQKARLLQKVPYSQRVIQYLVNIVSSLNDYDVNHFQVFRVVRRQTTTKSTRVSSDDLHKLGSSVYYMVIGLHSLHMIPVPDFSDSSGRLLIPKARKQAYGIVTLYSMTINSKGEDDRFELAFRMPLQEVIKLELAAFANPDIVLALYRAWQHLKPLWADNTFLYNGPEAHLSNGEDFMDYEGDDWFERTLVAYCIAYGCNASNIIYAIDLEGEDAPQFKLYPPASAAAYSVYELLAIMRALRYNEEFRSISFRDVNLHNLHGVHDIKTDHMCHKTWDGRDISQFHINPYPRSLLYREVQALALKSKTLRRMDFGNTLPQRRPKDTYDLETGDSDKDPGCEVIGAILALCKEQLTKVSWIVLSGIELGETDLEEMLPALNIRRSAVRAIECSRCGLSDRGIVQLLSHMEKQNATIECVNISDNSGRIDLERFSASMTRFSRIRRLDISRITRTSGDKPLIVAEVLLSWKLEELTMNGVPVNDETLDAIASYLKSPMSDGLRILQMDQCNLNGSQVAVLMRAMTRVPGEARELQLHVSANRFERGVGDIAAAIKDNCTPATFVARMIEFEKEDHFRELLGALRTNKTIRNLDISKASLPYDANPETCDALRLVFAENTTLQDLDISGEQAHLEVTRFGIGLNHALTGLKENTTLKVLRIEYQNLGLEGANTLASVLETNTGLVNIHCEHNDINLQGFTTLVNALAKNYTVLELPSMQDDQSASMKRLSVSLRETRNTSHALTREKQVKHSVGRTLTKLGVSSKTKLPRPDMTPQDLESVVRVLGERWVTEIQRMVMFLNRNNRIVSGEDSIDGQDSLSEYQLRPTTALSDGGILEQVLNNTTPRADLPNPVDEHVINKLGGLSVTDAEMTKDELNSVRSIESENDPMRALGTEPGDNRSESDKEAYMKEVEAGNLPSLPSITLGGKMFELDGPDLFNMED
ncbi:hypothetical protein LARI1_G000074 [Lachnellula arida]|uniref:PH domain-containing protein n=1 Tax=Lachnellula arida TaxID=1316785 RepID=A0A8T9BRZ0_9HELO|nr:hypothetical protein LARI1_G000074 [Lachnellula arida]